MDDRTLGREDLPFPLNRPLTGEDLLRLFPTLLQPLWSAAADACRLFVGEVVLVRTKPKSVDIRLDDGSVVTARYFPGYTPQVGDVVEGMHNTKATRVLGKPV